MIIITAHGEIEMAVEAMKAGAHDFLTKPVSFTQLEQSIQRAGELVAMRRELAHFRQSQQADVDFVIGETPEFKQSLTRRKELLRHLSLC